MSDIIYIDRLDGQQKIEEVYKGSALKLLYGDRFFNKLLGFLFLPLIARLPFFSQCYGYLQKRPASAKKILPFINKFNVDATEFRDPVSTFVSFNDFFIRHLKREVRPVVAKKDIAIIPADARYYFYQNIANGDGFIVKNKKFNLAELLGSESLAGQYADGSMIMARLCPTDYHRFHFPCDCIPDQAQLINGYLYSVNPLAVKKNLDIFTENKRMVTLLDTESFGQVAYLEIGATNVGSIRQTYTPFVPQLKGAEKGYFEFGGSALIILFAKGTIELDSDLITATQKGLEMRCLLGQSLGRALNLETAVEGDKLTQSFEL
jgi:phosphatidylserine decarboxylase